jgi:hypothetical protein
MVFRSFLVIWKPTHQKQVLSFHAPVKTFHDLFHSSRHRSAGFPTAGLCTPNSVLHICGLPGFPTELSAPWLWSTHLRRRPSSFFSAPFERALVSILCLSFLLILHSGIPPPLLSCCRNCSDLNMALFLMSTHPRTLCPPTPTPLFSLLLVWLISVLLFSIFLLKL